jgi:hypothetical protein
VKLEFELRSGLPPLSWCARARAGAPVQVLHGSGVEVRAQGFVEGAWDGDFERFDFDQAHTLAGSGGRLRDGNLVFAAPFHPLERLFVLRNSDEIWVSNSLPFLLTQSGDGLDPAHPNYYFDFIRHVRAGIAVPAMLHTAAGKTVEIVRACNLQLQPDGALHQTAKPLGPPPACYADYFAGLDGTTKTIARNAASPDRMRTYRMVAACSRGYDSTASAALASLAGCREGVTFARSLTPSGHPLSGVVETLADDSGADSLRALRMDVREYDRAAFSKLAGFPIAEFFISSPTAVTDAMSQLMDEVLRGSLFVSGRHGERYWGPTARCSRRDFREIDDCHLSGQALGEFRLRVGFLHYPAPYVGALHGPAIFRITHSPEMQPWKLGRGYYDRPIARRIAEQAGVPREYFGQTKLGAGLASYRDLNPESERDFQDFLHSEVPESVRRRLDPRPLIERLPRHRKLAYLRTQYAHWPAVCALLDGLPSERMHMMWNSVRLYQFHWGFSKTASRYAGGAVAT